MRPLLALFATALTLATASASGQPVPAASSGEAAFVVSGRGYGHGVGMSQYGAYGQALAGRTYDQILGHYYTGTEIGKAGRKEVRVLLAEVVAPSRSRRPGHDRRYLLDATKIREELGWKASRGFDEGLAETVAWYEANRDWWEPLKARAPVEESAWK